MKALIKGVSSICVALSIATPANSEPFSAFSRDELNAIVQVLVDSGGLQTSSRIARTALMPPAKTGPTARRARVTLLDASGTQEVIVDLDQSTVLGWETVLDGRSPVLSAEWARASSALKSDVDWQQAMAKRGYETFDDIFCESLSAGYFPDRPAATRRVLRMPCYDVSEATTHIYGRPIEGLVATIDAQTGAVLEILDEGVIPVPGPAPQPRSAEPLKQEPVSADLALDNQRITFGPWDLHVRLDDQFGLIVNDAGFDDRGTRRSVLASGHVAEIFVPYMDPTDSWAFRTYLDAGEFGLGTLTSSLVGGYDCPANARYLNALTLSPLGRVIEKRDAICVFSREMDGPLWRHYEALNGQYAGLTGRELVVRSIASIAHYDYLMDWIFRPQGEIEIRIGATGIDAVKAVPDPGKSDPYDRLVTPELAAVYHDHFFSLRLDLDVDGPTNRLVREHVRQHARVASGLRRSYWTLEPETVRVEGKMAAPRPGVWRIESTDHSNALGHPTAYQLVTDTTTSLLSADDWPQKRAAFSSASLWATRYDVAEMAAAGGYPNQSRGGHGLSEFADGENLVDVDLVLWPTVGFRHVTRPEDWPILSTVWKSVLLKPYGFFDSNPTVHDGN